MLAIAICWPAASVPAQSPSQGDFTVRHFRFHTGDTLPELRLHYTTLGAAHGSPVLLLHGTGGSAAEFLADDVGAQLYAHGQPLDTSQYFIIIPDAIGHGQSFKPSDGLRTRFPRYNYDDMVEAQYRLLTEHLGVKHLRLVLGSSMGGMLTWLWGARHPDYMDVLLPLASEPAPMAGRNWMTRRMVLDAIRADPDWHDGHYTTQPTAWRKSLVWFSIATNGGSRSLYRAFPTTALADEQVNRRLARLTNRDAVDALYQFDASRDYDLRRRSRTLPPAYSRSTRSTTNAIRPNLASWRTRWRFSSMAGMSSCP